ncbi:hypothetical protein G4V62_18865 [Bacillaceae bacterium SIJ1]|uniref:hypothetical protein n=1 Tax=Litoribacterium kuwaitense TaxID=1398745 RepID=UPI0013EDD005|nr:hypothetical protein [Litoribacterium kuwaitense]NGP46892.1 hypothetical protein [Litoribacterium kuwaitense]
MQQQVLAGLKDHYKAKEDIEALKKEHNDIYQLLLHVASLTRQLQIRYRYLGALLTNTPAAEFEPKFIRSSVLELYQREVQTLKNHPNFDQVQALFKANPTLEFPNIFLLVLGAKPEMVHGSTFMK